MARLNGAAAYAVETAMVNVFDEMKAIKESSNPIKTFGADLSDLGFVDSVNNYSKRANKSVQGLLANASRKGLDMLDIEYLFNQVKYIVDVEEIEFDSKKLKAEFEEVTEDQCPIDYTAKGNKYKKIIRVNNDYLATYDKKGNVVLLRVTTNVVNDSIANKAQWFLDMYLESIDSKTMYDVKGKGHTVSSMYKTFNGFVYGGKLDGRYDLPMYAQALFLRTKEDRKHLNAFYSLGEKVDLSTPEAFVYFKNKYADRLVISSIAQGKSGFIARTPEIKKEMDEFYTSMGAKYSLEGRYAVEKVLETKTIKVVLKSVNVREYRNLEGGVVGQILHDVNATQAFTGEKLMAIVERNVAGIIYEEIMRLKFNTTWKNCVDESQMLHRVIDANGNLVTEVLFVTDSEIKAATNKDGKKETVVKGSGELLTAIRKSAISTEIGTCDGERVEIFTIKVGVDEVVSANYNVHDYKKSRVYDSMFSVASKEVKAFMLANLIDWNEVENAIWLSQTERNDIEVEVVDGKLVESFSIDESIYSRRNILKGATIQDLTSNSKVITDKSVLLAAFFGNANIMPAQITNLLAFIGAWNEIEQKFETDYNNKSENVDYVIGKELEENLRKILVLIANVATREAIVTLEDAIVAVKERMNVWKRIIKTGSYDKLRIQKVQFQKPASSMTRLAGEVVEVATGIQKFALANILTLTKNSILSNLNFRKATKAKAEAEELRVKGLEAAARGKETSAANYDKSQTEQLRKAEEEFHKIRANAREMLADDLAAFSVDRLTLTSTLFFANIGVDEMLVPRSWQETKGIQKGDILLTLRHPVTRRLIILRVTGFTQDETVKVSHLWYEILGADADGDQINVIKLGDETSKWTSHVESNPDLGIDKNQYEEALRNADLKIGVEEVLTKEQFEEDAINNYVGKQMTKDITGILGAFVKRILKAYVATGRVVTPEEEEAIYTIQQIAVQGKNVGKRGLYENDPEVLNAIKAGEQFGADLDISKLVKTFFERYLQKETKEEVTINSFDDYFGL